MKAIVYNKKARPDKLIFSDVEKPVPNDNEVLVKIAAVSVNAADYRSMKMGMIPKKKIFGAEILSHGLRLADLFRLKKSMFPVR